jgi:hypothetical protein
MGLRFADGTVFRRVWLDVEDRSCRRCGGAVKICDHRHHRIWTLQGAWHLTSRLVHCSDGSCPGRHTTISPESELSITMPRWGIGWDLFCWVGHRRFARHWSVPQMRAELSDTYGVGLSADAIEKHIKRYRHMVAARQEDMELMREEYHDVPAVILTIDGLQPEKGHETLYVVRELTRKRVWFAEALLSSSAEEVRRLLVRAKQMAQALGTFVELWMSDKQDAFVSGIAAEFVGVPHRFCQNHFMRDLAKPTLEMDSHAKVQMRSKVRGLRAIEREVLHEAQAAAATVAEAADGEIAVGTAGPAGTAPTAPSPAEEVVLDYCASVRGILNDDQGGPLHPPGLRMAAGLAEVRASLTRNLAAKKGGAPSRC